MIYRFQIKQYYITLQQYNKHNNKYNNKHNNNNMATKAVLTKHPVEEVKFGSWKLHGVCREKLHHTLLLDKIMWQVGSLLEENVREHSRGSETLVSTDDSQQYHCYYD